MPRKRQEPTVDNQEGHIARKDKGAKECRKKSPKMKMTVLYEYVEEDPADELDKSMYCETDSDPNDLNGSSSFSNEREPNVTDGNDVPTSDEEDDSIDGPTITNERIGEQWNENIGEYEIYLKSAAPRGTAKELPEMVGKGHFEDRLNAIIEVYEANYKHQEHWTDEQFRDDELVSENDLGGRWALFESPTGHIVFDASTNKYREDDGTVEYIPASVEARDFVVIADAFVIRD